MSSYAQQIFEPLHRKSGELFSHFQLDQIENAKKCINDLLECKSDGFGEDESFLELDLLTKKTGDEAKRIEKESEVRLVNWMLLASYIFTGENLNNCAKQFFSHVIKGVDRYKEIHAKLYIQLYEKYLFESLENLRKANGYTSDREVRLIKRLLSDMCLLRYVDITNPGYCEVDLAARKLRELANEDLYSKLQVTMASYDDQIQTTLKEFIGSYGKIPQTESPPLRKKQRLCDPQPDAITITAEQFDVNEEVPNSSQPIDNGVNTTEQDESMANNSGYISNSGNEADNNNSNNNDSEDLVLNPNDKNRRSIPSNIRQRKENVQVVIQVGKDKNDSRGEEEPQEEDGREDDREIVNNNNSEISYEEEEEEEEELREEDGDNNGYSSSSSSSSSSDEPMRGTTIRPAGPDQIQMRRPPMKWTEDEVNALEEGLRKWQHPVWTQIKEDAKSRLCNRSSVDVKDKARTEYKKRLRAGEDLGIYSFLEIRRRRY